MMVQNEIARMLASAGVTDVEGLAALIAKAQQKAAGRSVTVKRSDKGAISVYGINSKFPVTLYAPQWHRLIKEAIPQIEAEIATGKYAAKDGTPFRPTK